MGPTRQISLDEVAKIGHVVLDSILKCATALWLDDHKGDVQSATCTLLHLGERDIGVTCHHVLDAREGRDLYIGGAKIDPSWVISSCDHFDLATIDLTAIASHLRGRGKLFHHPVRWPPNPVADSDILSFCGFPGKWRKDLTGKYKFDFRAFGHGMTGVDQQSADHIATQLLFSKCAFLVDGGFPLEDLRGISGGPAFAYRELHQELVGFAYEDQRNLDVLRIRKACLIDESGKVLDHPR